MDRPLTDRRRAARFAAGAHGLRGTLRPGCAALLIDVSTWGTLIETSKPLRPGAAVHLQVRVSGRGIAVSAHILRCMVWSLDPLDGILYRGALRFDRPVDWSAAR